MYFAFCSSGRIAAPSKVEVRCKIETSVKMLIFIAVCGAGLVLLLAYGASAEFSVIQGKHISDAQEAAIAWIVLIAVIVGSAIGGWLSWKTRGDYEG